MKRVLFVIRELCGGGAERALSNIVTHFPDDWEIDILLNNRNDIDYPYKGNILTLEIPEPENRSSVIHQGWAIIKRTKVLRELKKNNRYAACISFLDSSNISNVLSGKKFCRTIISIRADMASKESSLWYRLSAIPLIRLLYCRADKIVAVSKEIQESMVKNLHIKESRITAIVNGYDCAGLNKAKKEPLNETEEKLFQAGRVVLAAGRLCTEKAHWHLIRAFKKAADIIPDIKLIIFGEGILKEYLQELITGYGLEGKVILGGFISNPFKMLARCELFVMPSLSEGFPNALAEAVCCEVPCISADFHSGAREVLAPDMPVLGKRVESVTKASYGILTPVCSGMKYSASDPLEKQEECLAEAMIMLLCDKEKREYYGKQSLERSKSLDIREVVDSWLTVINNQDGEK